MRTDEHQFALRKLTANSQLIRLDIFFLLPIPKTRNIKIIIFRISTMLNSKADDLSRSSTGSTEWELPQEIFDSLTYQKGHLQIDLMATSKKTKLPTYVSPHPDPCSMGCNALSLELEQVGSNLLVSTQVAYSSEHTETECLLPSRNDNSPMLPGGTLVPLRQVQGSQTLGALPSRSNEEWTASSF